MREDRSTPSSLLVSLVPAVIIAAGLIVCASIAARSFVRARTGEEIIRVIGSARKPIRSDFIIWRACVSRSAPTASQAYTKLEADASTIKAYLVKNGIPATSIVPSSISTETLYAPPPKGPTGIPEYGNAVRRVIGYQLSQEIEVQSSQVDLVDRISRQSTELISKGISFESRQPLYLYTRMSQLKVTMQAEAARDALARAEQIAKSSGCRVGKLRFARMNVPQITPIYSAQESDGGVDDTTSIDKKITAIVVAGYSIR